MAGRRIGGVRCHVVITNVQDSRLKQLAVKTGMRQAEHIRRAIDSYFRLLDAAQERKKT